MPSDLSKGAQDLTDTGENVKKWTRVFFDSALSHPRRSDASERKKIACPLLDVFACGQVSSPRLYGLKITKKNFNIYGHLAKIAT